MPSGETTITKIDVSCRHAGYGGGGGTLDNASALSEGQSENGMTTSERGLLDANRPVNFHS